MTKSREQNSSPITVTAYVVDTLRKGILAGDYQIGEKLDQKLLAEKLGVSIIPVREGLRQLEAEGLIRLVPRRGAFVAELSIAELKEIYLIREVLEGLAAELAVPNLDPSTFHQLESLLEQMEEATAQQDFSHLLELNRAFHFTIYESSRCPLLLQIIASLWDRSSLCRRVYLYLPGRASQALAEHKEIYQASKQGDAQWAHQAVRKNVHQTIEGILARMNQEKMLKQENG
ncbi:MAG: GntR family transcriptional regulator [Roseiflexus sp.]|jgi:DNA-binding GntR family transcriptional regulator|uniref:GntR family transcriptional regulator n=1 Tax=Roseiflexus sp. TaxID=2562120 RepID=UPI0025F3CBE6|nr:GntR family transcriptional regulator [Roseiflexus sp.]MCL6542524.1 GntR family transcriptional regulator [Roseiflexus sp.]